MYPFYVPLIHYIIIRICNRDKRLRRCIDIQVSIVRLFHPIYSQSITRLHERALLREGGLELNGRVHNSPLIVFSRGVANEQFHYTADDKGRRENIHRPHCHRRRCRRISTEVFVRCLITQMVARQLLDVESHIFKALAPAYPSTEIKDKS